MKDNYSYEILGDRLIIQVKHNCWTMDQVPSWLREIFTELWLNTVEQIRHIEIQDV